MEYEKNPSTEQDAGRTGPRAASSSARQRNVHSQFEMKKPPLDLILREDEFA
jgi:hypothetical protein